MSEQRWTIEACPKCGAQTDDPPSYCNYCETGGHLERVVVVPASVLDEARSRVRELEDALRKIAESPWTSVRESERGLAVLAQRPVPFQEDDPKLYSSSSESPVDAVARIGQDVQPDGYAKHLGADSVRVEGPHNGSSAPTDTPCPDCKGGGPFFPLGCDRCSGSGRVTTTTNDPEEGPR